MIYLIHILQPSRCFFNNVKARKVKKPMAQPGRQTAMGDTRKRSAAADGHGDDRRKNLDLYHAGITVHRSCFSRA